MSNYNIYMTAGKFYISVNSKKCYLVYPTSQGCIVKHIETDRRVHWFCGAYDLSIEEHRNLLIMKMIEKEEEREAKILEFKKENRKHGRLTRRNKAFRKGFRE